MIILTQIDVLIISLIVLISLVPRILTARKICMTFDEGLYALCGMMGLKNIVTRKFSSADWNFEFHPPFIMYLFGLSYGIYVFTSTALKRKSIPALKLLFREAISLFRGRRALLAIRFPSLILGSLSCIITYFITLDILGDRTVAATAALLLALTPSFISWSSLAMLESGITFFYLLTIWTLLRAIESNSLGLIVVSGVSLGLTFASKETGLGILLVVPPWLALSKTFMLEQRSWLLVLWLMLGFAIFYLMWPWLWRNPIKQFFKNFRSVLKMPSRTEGDFKYYLVNLLAVTPIPLIFLYGVGMFEIAFLTIEHEVLYLILFWVIVPLVGMSMPPVPKRGGAFEVTFVLPPLSIFASLAVQRLSQVVASNLYLNGQLTLLLSSFGFIGLVFLDDLGIHPYYVDYYNQLIRRTSRTKKMFPFGWWGEGMDEAMAYIDRHAPRNTTVWIYGPKTTAFYHSSRVSLEKSLRDQHLFHMRTVAGFQVRTDQEILTWRRGDLRFYFPHYHSSNSNSLDITRLKAENVGLILIYRWATYELANYWLVSTLRSQYTPVFTSKIKGIEVCWVYDVNEFLVEGDSKATCVSNRTTIHSTQHQN